MHICLEGKQQVSEQPLVHGRPLEFWDAEHSGAWARTELPALFLCHGHASKTQINTQVPLQLGCTATMKGLKQGGEELVSQQMAFGTPFTVI